MPQITPAAKFKAAQGRGQAGTFKPSRPSIKAYRYAAHSRSDRQPPAAAIDSPNGQTAGRDNDRQRAVKAQSGHYSRSRQSGWSV